MRLLLIGNRDPGQSRLLPLARHLVAAGHEVAAVAPALEPIEGAHTASPPGFLRAGKRREAAVAALAARHLGLRRPDAALVEASVTTSATSAVLRARSVPYLLTIDERLLDDLHRQERLPISAQMAHHALRLSARGARHAVVPNIDLAVHVATELGLSEVDVVEAGLDLSQLPLGDRGEARAALGLPPAHRIAGLVGPLTASTRLDLLAMAHRQVAGVGLLVAGSGPEERTLFAMATATRPSSPVQHVGPKTPATLVTVGCAAEVGLALNAERLPDETMAWAALGRRVVVFDAPGVAALDSIYPDHRAVFVAQPTIDDLKRALEEALEEERAAGPLPDDAVARARARLDEKTHPERLAEVLMSCA